MVSVVADGLSHREGEDAMVKKLVAAGVAEAEAPALFVAIKTAMQQGVQAVFTDGLSSPDGPPADPLLREAFRVGQARMRAASRGALLRRLVMPALVVAGLAFVLWRFLR